MSEKEKKQIADACEEKKIKCKTLVIQEHGAKYKTTFTEKFENRKAWVKPNPDNLISYIPGTITEVCVKEGDKVKKGDKMLILEAMKMLNTLEIPRDSTVKKIHVKVGDKIPKGHLLVEIA